MLVPGFTLMKREEKREVCVVGVEKIEETEIEGVVAGHGGKEGIQQDVAFVVELRVVDTEDLVELRRCLFNHPEIAVIEDNGQGKLAEVVAVEFDFLDSFPQFAHLRFLRIVEQPI